MKKHILFLAIILMTISCTVDEERPESINYPSMYLMTDNPTERMLYGSWKSKGSSLTVTKNYMDPILGKREAQISDDKDYPAYLEQSFDIEENFFKPGLHLYRLYGDGNYPIVMALEFLDSNTYEMRLLKYDRDKPMEEWEISKDAATLIREK
ncbi:MAG: hypothetical protein ACRCVW_07320 [Brevinema sp.]